MSRKVLVPLALPGDPTQPLEAVTKQYVDALPAWLSGVGLPSKALGKTTDFYLDESSGGTHERVASGADATNLLTNPSMETGSTVNAVRTNMHPNPTAVSSGTTWWNRFMGASGNGSGAYQTGQSGWAFGVTTSYRATWSVASTTISGGIYLGNPTIPSTAAISAVAGKYYSAAVQVRCSKVQRMRLVIQWYDAANTLLGGAVAGPEVVLAANTVTLLTVSGVLAPATTDHMSVTAYSTAGTSASVWDIGDWLEGCWAHIEETDQTLTTAGGTAEQNAVRRMFSGGLTSAGIGLSADYTLAWSGTANASPSEMRGATLAGWSAGSVSVVSQSTDRATDRAKAARLLWGTLAGTGTALQSAAMSLDPAKTYTLSASVWVPTGSPTVRIGYNTGGATFAGNDTGSTKDQWVRLSVTFTPVAGNTWLYPALSSGNTVRGDDQCYIDSVMLEEGSSATAYFDGSTANTEGNQYAWTGTADASTSTRTSTPWVLRTPPASTNASLLTNPSFEQAPDYAGWTLFWTVGAPVSSIDTTDSHDGVRSTKSVFAASGDAQRYGMASTFRVVPGVEYQMACWVKGVSCRIELNALTGPTAAQAEYFVAGGQSNILVDTAVDSTVWVKYFGRIVIPAGHFYVRPYFSLFARAATTMWLDDCEFRLYDPISNQWEPVMAMGGF